jgi:hypothetical protein
MDVEQLKGEGVPQAPSDESRRYNRQIYTHMKPIPDLQSRAVKLSPILGNKVEGVCDKRSVKVEPKPRLRTRKRCRRGFLAGVFGWDDIII